MKRLAAEFRLIACLVAILLVMAVLAGLTYSVLSQANKTFDTAVNSTARKLWIAGDIDAALDDMLVAQASAQHSANRTEVRANAQNFLAKSDRIDHDIQAFVTLPIDRDEIEIINTVQATNASHRKFVETLVRGEAVSTDNAARDEDESRNVDKDVDRLQVLEAKYLADSLAKSRGTMKLGRTSLGVCAAFALLVVLVALRALKSMAHSLRSAASEANDAAVFWASIVDNMPCAVCIFDVHGNVKRWNHNFLGYTLEEILESGALIAIEAESQETVRLSLARALEAGYSETDAYMKTKDGRRIPAYLSHRRFDYDGESCILGVGIDISKQKQAEQFSRLQRVALESASEAIVITDETGSIEWANPAFTALTGYELEEVLGSNPRILKSGMMNREFYKLLWSTILRGEKWSGELWNLNKDGNVYCEEMHIAPVRAVNESISNFVAVKHDITERKQLEAQAGRAKQDLLTLNKKLQDANESILRISQTDALTGLANRRTIDTRMEEEIARTDRLGCGFSVILGDLDHFKSINDEFGHQTGDRVLTTVAKVLSEHARPYDLPARFGGEEFMVLLPESTLEEAMTIAQRIRCEVAAVVVPGIARQITMSLGISSWEHGDTAGEMIRRADAALYEAKRRGRNRVVADTIESSSGISGVVFDGEKREVLVRTA